MLVATGLVAGSSFPPAGAVLRSRWPELLSGDPTLIRGAYAFDSVTIELSFVSGPLIAGGLVAVSGPEAALAPRPPWSSWARSVPVPAPAPAPGAPGERAHRGPRAAAPSGDPDDRPDHDPRGLLHRRRRGGAPAFSEEAGDAALAGLLLALWSAASGVGGLIFGARQSRRELLDTYLVIGLVFPLACLPLVAASSPLSMALLVLLAGAPIAPLIATRNELISQAAPQGTGTEAFTWLMTALIAGLSWARRSEAR